MTPPAGPLLDAAVARCARATRHVLDEMATLTAGDLDQPTPCAGWDVRSVVVHLADVADSLGDLLVTGRLTLPAAPAADVADPVALAGERLGRLMTGLAAVDERGAPDRVRWAVAAASGGAIEFTAHGWDLAAARGRPDQLPDELAADVLALATELIDEGSRGAAFGPPVTGTPGASAGEQLAAFLGRDPHRWRSLVSAPDVTAGSGAHSTT